MKKIISILFCFMGWVVFNTVRATPTWTVSEIAISGSGPILKEKNDVFYLVYACGSYICFNSRDKNSAWGSGAEITDTSGAKIKMGLSYHSLVIAEDSTGDAVFHLIDIRKNSTAYELTYIHRKESESNWTVEKAVTLTITSSSGVYSDIPTLTIDDDGALYAFYIDNAMPKLAIRNPADGSWTTQNVGTATGPSKYSSLPILVDTEGTIHVVYISSSKLYHSYLLSGSTSWSTEVVSATGMSANYWAGISFNKSPDNTFHVIYEASESGVGYFMLHAYGSTGSWTNEKVESLESADEYCDIYPSLAIDDDGNLNLLYNKYCYSYDSSTYDYNYSGNIKYVSKASGSSSWSSPVEVGEAYEFSFENPSLIIDSDGDLDAVYQNSSQGISFANSTTENINPSGNSSSGGGGCSLVVE